MGWDAVVERFLVDLLGSVTFGFRPSIHAAVKAAGAIYLSQPCGGRSWRYLTPTEYREQREKLAA